MAGIFPPAAQGGIPPGPDAPNGYTPANAVLGEGPLYSSADCSTVLTVQQLNAMVSEILAAVDRLGFAFNAGIITNLGDALKTLFDALPATYVNVSGDTMTGPLILAADPTDPLGAATKQYAVARAGDTMTGPLILSGDPVVPLGAAPKQYVDVAVGHPSTDPDDAMPTLTGQLAAKVSKSGDTMAGPLVLAADPTALMQAATKQYVDNTDGARKTYVDNADALRVLKAGDTMSGPLILSGNPTTAMQAATKQYVDMGVGGGGVSAAYVDAQDALRVLKA